MSNVMTKQALLVYLESAQEDFMILVYDEARMKEASKIADNAIAEWFDDEEKAGDDTMSEYVSKKLKEINLNHDIYYNPQVYDN